jgi:hypothetical protein
MLASTLIEALALEFGEAPQDGDVVATLLGMIRDVVQEINIAGEWKHTRLSYPFDTNVGSNTVNLPETVGSIIAIQRTDTGRPLQYLNLETLTDGSLTLDTPGEAAFWHYDKIADGVPKLRLYPTPDVALSYVVYYEDSTHDIASEDSSLPVPNDFVPVLKHGVREMYYAQTNPPQPALIQLYGRKFLNGIRSLRGRYEHVRRDQQGVQYNDIDAEATWPTPQLPSTYERIG